MIQPVPDSRIKEAVRILEQGGLIAFPTETCYALGVDPFNKEALRRLFQVKQRATAKPILVLVAEKSYLPLLAASLPVHFETLMHAFWPGPLTLVFPALIDVPELLTGGTGTVGIRVSSHPVAQCLLQKYQWPITATSANRSGRLAATTASEVKKIFGLNVDLVLDGGTTPGGQGSTLVGEKNGDIFCIREGRIPFIDIRAAL
ncbi:MAG: threonylcarbamoyl-AMP synthase [Desulfocapsa sp.]|nr:MAG: threonylcarbamoyl-AMP synthase [Desulfocapsa sp.]